MGGVRIAEWPEQGWKPNVLAVSLQSDCFIPCHQHLSGALYVVLSGEFFVTGDGGHHNTTYHGGDIRWARPSYVYGPEMAGMTGSARINVLGLPGVVEAGQCHDHHHR